MPLLSLDNLFFAEVPIGLAFILVASIAYIFFQSKGPSLRHIPIWGEEIGSVDQRKAKYALDGLSVFREGYEKFKKGPFQVPTSMGPKIVVGPAAIDELRRFPDDIVDEKGPISDILIKEYTGFAFPDEAMLHSMRAELNPKLGVLTPIVAEEIDRCISTELASCEEWTPVQVYQATTRIVAIVSTRIFIGEALCHNEDWIKVALGYTNALGTAARAIKVWNPWLRPLVYRFLPQVRELFENRNGAMRLLKPIVRARRLAEKQKGYKKPDDMLQWMMDARAKQGLSDDVQWIVRQQLTLTFAAIDTTGNAVTNIIYDLAAMPEYVPILREEVSTELAKNGGVWDGQLTKALKKTDSFMKESQRHHPVAWCTFMRKILKAVTLKDGTYLPAGSIVHGNTHMVSNDSDVHNGEDFTTFDGLRYYKMSTSKGAQTGQPAGAYQFVSTSLGSLMFGYGKHACPGRFFAANEIKVLLTKLLMRFDFKLDGTTERYPTVVWEDRCFVDKTKNTLFKRATA